MRTRHFVYTKFKNCNLHIHLYFIKMVRKPTIQNAFQQLQRFLYYFLLRISRESIVFGSNFKMEILMDLHVLRSPKSENHIFSVQSGCMYVRVCVCVCVRVCVSVISITENQITAESSNLAFYICVIARCYLKLFIKSCYVAFAFFFSSKQEVYFP